MGKKTKKIGRTSENTSRRTVRILRTKSKNSSSPVVEFHINTGYQGVKQVKELAEIERVTLNQRILDKQQSKKGHLNIEEIREVLENPDGIYYDGDAESWLYTQTKTKTKKIVIKKESTAHRIATAYVISTEKFNQDVEKFKLQLIWQR